MMNLIKLLVPFMGLVAASNSTNATTSTAAPTTAAPTTAAANTTAAATNTTKAKVVTKKANATKSVTIDVPAVFEFKGVDKTAFVDKSKSLIAGIPAQRRMSASNLTDAQVKELLTITAKSFSASLGDAGKADRKVTIKGVAADDAGIEITFRVTLTGASATAAAGDALKTKVQSAAFKDALTTKLKEDIAASTVPGIKDMTPTVHKIKEPKVTLAGGVTAAPAAKTTTAASGAVSFVAPVGAMLAAAFALF